MTPPWAPCAPLAEWSRERAGEPSQAGAIAAAQRALRLQCVRQRRHAASGIRACGAAEPGGGSTYACSACAGGSAGGEPHPEPREQNLPVLAGDEEPPLDFGPHLERIQDLGGNFGLFSRLYGSRKSSL